MREELRELLAKQGYGFAGEHGGVKMCHWSKEDLKEGGRHCYKGDFYGIESHRCMQMTPVVDYCNFRCLYCWRSQDFDNHGPRTWDDPQQLLSDAVAEQQRLLSGYKGKSNTDIEKWIRANRPKHVAISLNGEPTAYPRLAEFIRLCHQYDMTTFLVTNGSFPDALVKLEAEDALPTQLYISVDAPNKEIFDRLCVPLTQGAWEKMTESLEIAGSLDTRIVARHTLVKGWNMGHYDEYAALDRLCDADFVECKGYVHIGYSRERMREENMPSHSEIRQFSERLSKELGYPVEDERADSRVCLLVRPGADRFLTEQPEADLVPLTFPAGRAEEEEEELLPMAGSAPGGGCGSTCGCGH